jgi:hypothetical protein
MLREPSKGWYQKSILTWAAGEEKVIKEEERNQCHSVINRRNPWPQNCSCSFWRPCVYYWGLSMRRVCLWCQLCKYDPLTIPSTQGLHPKRSYTVKSGPGEALCWVFPWDEPAALALYMNQWVTAGENTVQPGTSLYLRKSTAPPTVFGLIVFGLWVVWPINVKSTWWYVPGMSRLNDIRCLSLIAHSCFWIFFSVFLKPSPFLNSILIISERINWIKVISWPINWRSY